MKIMARLFLLSFLLLSLFPAKTLAAEVLQVRNSSLLQIGDQNRTYTVELACVQIDPSFEDEARDWLRSELPRRTRVNFRPEGSNKGVLKAKVIAIGTNMEISKGLADEGFGFYTC